MNEEGYFSGLFDRCTTKMSAKRLSGLQKDVLSLYREILREALKKEKSNLATSASASASSSSTKNSFLDLMSKPENTVSYARSEFRKQAYSVKRSDFRTIEYSVRKGKKHIKLLQMPGVKVVGGSSGN